MIQLKYKSDCCGCEGCKQICPTQCIQFSQDNEGFYYPKIELNKCINCHRCENVCPMKLNYESFGDSFTKKIYAAKNLIPNERKNSSSGGIFIKLAQQTIRSGGVVIGASFNNNFDVIHKSVQTIAEIKPLMRSKYVQSRINDIYNEIKLFLNNGRSVLFVGTPCQVFGCKKFLGKEYENLKTVDVICHGVPSPGLWEQYLNELKDQNNQVKIKEIIFRDKENYDWSHYGFKIIGEEKELFNDFAGNNAYFKAFISNNSLRPSCYKCKFKKNSEADITLGDFWGIEDILPKFSDEKGTSLVIINSLKGLDSFNSLEIEKIEIQNQNILNKNISYNKSANCPITRKRFFKLCQNSSLSLDEIMNKIQPNWSNLNFIEKIKYTPSRALNYLVRKLNFLR